MSRFDDEPAIRSDGVTLYCAGMGCRMISGLRKAHPEINRQAIHPKPANAQAAAHLATGE